MLTAHCARAAKRSLLLTLAVLIGSPLVVGCNDAAKQAAQANAAATAPQLSKPALLPANAPEGAVPQPAPVVQTAAGPKAPSAVQTKSPSIPSIPADARWTIFCFRVIGASHASDANKTRDRLNATSGRSDWYVINGRDSSNIYFGFYSTVESNSAASAKAADKAQTDLAWVQARAAADGSKPFSRSVFVALDSPDPTAPTEWNLFEVDRHMSPADEKRAFWSLQIMAFRGDSQRKEAAVQAVRDLRAQGHDAYFHHGEIVSSVTIGKWPASAVKSQNRTSDMPDVAHSNPDSTLIVSSLPVADTLSPKQMDDKRSVLVAPKLEIVDESMKAAMQKFPTHAVNYEIGVQRTVEGREILDSSFLVEIPRAKGNGLFDAANNQPVVQDNDTGFRQPGASMINSRNRSSANGTDGEPRSRRFGQ